MVKSKTYTVFAGTDLEYKSLHKRVSTRFGTAKYCEECPRTSGTRFDWANVSGEYREHDRSDWARLCRFCHMKRDAANFDGKRFTGHNHSPKSRKQISETLRRDWRENREKRMDAIRKMVATKLANKKVKEKQTNVNIHNKSNNAHGQKE